MKLSEAVNMLEEYLTKHHGGKFKAKVYTYSTTEGSRPFAGVMVCEVSFLSTEFTGGFSYMQSDTPYGIAICGLAERVLLSYLENWEEQEIQEQLDLISYALIDPNI